MKAGSQEIFAQPHSWQHCSEEPRDNTNPDVPDRGMDRQNVIYTYNETPFHSKMKEIWKHATTWIKLRDITLSEICQSQKMNTA